MNNCDLCDIEISEYDYYCQDCLKEHEHEYDISDMGEDYIRYTCDICGIEYMETRR